MPEGSVTPLPAARSGLRLRRFLAVFWPGLVVMLADTDVGSVITAAQSGMQWGYRLLLLQLALIPLLYLVQELDGTARRVHRRGHGELIRDVFGPRWAWVSVAVLGIATVGALLTEFSGVAGVGDLYGVPRALSLPIAAAVLLVTVLSGSYRRVERVAIAVGLFELAFFFVAWAAHPNAGAVLAGSLDIPLENADFRYLAAANIGSVIMPWMIFYQQAAIADKRFGPLDLVAARWDTALGAVLTQLVMAAVLIACAATIGRGGPGASLSSVGQISQALTPFLGQSVGRLVFGLGVLGAGMVAAIVVSLALAWGLGEVTGYRHALERNPMQTRWFLLVYALCVGVGAVGVGIWPDLVSLSVAVQVMNALMLPLVLGMLIAVAAKALPPAQRMRGWYLCLIITVATVTAAAGVIGGLSGIAMAWR